MVRVNFFGDFKCDDVTNLSFDEGLQNVLSSGDVNIVNFEAPIAGESSSKIVKDGPAIYQDKRAPQFLQEKAFNIISLANNHAMDFGAEGLHYTKEAFSPCEVIGAGDWEEAYKPIYKTIGIYKIAFLALTHLEFGVLAEKAYQNDEVGTAWMSHPIVDELIVKTKKGCDYLFLYVHAGFEYESYPLLEMRTQYRHYVEMGADGVIASHPHVPQPWELYQGKPIAYSLGNFCFDIKGDKDSLWYWSVMMSITIDDNGNINLNPYYCYYDKNSRIVSVNNDNEEFNNHIKHINYVFQDERKYIHHVNKCILKNGSLYYNKMAIYSIHNASLKVVLKQIIKRLLSYKGFEAPQVLNMIRCESHRWLISRYIVLANKIESKCALIREE